VLAVVIMCCHQREGFQQVSNGQGFQGIRALDIEGNRSKNQDQQRSVQVNDQNLAFTTRSNKV
jgi:hypothetical protein